jgi:hypothetical protein
VTPILYTLSEADVISGMRYGIVRNLRKNTVKLTLLVSLVSVLVSLVIFAISPGSGKDFLMLFGGLLATYAAGMLLFMICAWLFISKIRTRKSFKQMPALSREQQLSWDDSGFHIKSSSGDTKIPFDEIHQWAANSGQVLIYPSDYMHFVMPARIFEPASLIDDLTHRLEQCRARRI